MIKLLHLSPRERIRLDRIRPKFDDKNKGVLEFIAPRTRLVETDYRPTTNNNPILEFELTALERLMAEKEIPSSESVAFEKHVDQFADRCKRQQALSQLPSKPTREIRPYEGVIGYIKDADGLGPWLEAGVLTRPMVKELSPKAYTALANWLKNPRHNLENEGLHIPTKPELTDMELGTRSEEVRDFKRLASANEYRSRR